MDFGSSHVYEYDDSGEEYISDEELRVGMFLRYELFCQHSDLNCNYFISCSDDSDDELPTTTAGELACNVFCKIRGSVYNKSILIMTTIELF